MSAKYLSPEMLNECRLQSVRLRLDGHTVAEVATRTGLSAPTVSAAWKAFREGGWEAVPVRPRGRRAGQAARLDARGAVGAGRMLARASGVGGAGLEQSRPGRCAHGGGAWRLTACHRSLAGGARPQARAHGPGSTRAQAWSGGSLVSPAGRARCSRRSGKAGGNIWQGGVRIARPTQQEAVEASARAASVTSSTCTASAACCIAAC